MSLTSGVYNTLSLTRDAVILRVLQEMQVVDASVTVPGANDVLVIAQEMGMMLEEWRVEGLLLWCRDTLQIPTVANKRSYTIGPSGADFTSYRPLRALIGSYSRQTVGSNVYDTQLTPLSRLEYQMLSGKSTGGVANSFYYDPQMGSGAYDPTLGMGVLYLFNQPVDNTRTIFLEVQRPIQDVAASNQTFDLPLEWYGALMLCLAARCVNVYQVPENLANRIIRAAGDRFKKLADWGAQEQAPFTFQPDMQMRVQQRG